jgi:nitric oxide reductase subunit B
MQTGLMDTLRWLRVVGDTVFAIGIVLLGWFVLGLKTGWSLHPDPDAIYPAVGTTVAAGK